jgi:signal transduction histidine kinase
MFGPLRRLAQRVADRLVYGKRATPYEVLAEFSGRLGTTYADEDVTSRMAQLLLEATGAESAHVWLAVGAGSHPVASAPSDAAAATWPADGVEVQYRGEQLGGLSVQMPANDPLDPRRRKLIDDLAGQAGPVLANVRLIEELRASRRRIVSAQDARAKKLERDIHDGAQQQLVALTVKLRLLEQIADRDPAGAKEMASSLQADATGALEDLRDLARGIYPPLLADKGLGAALEAQARKASVQTAVAADGVGRFSPEVESAVYFSCLEALQNVAKYAEATLATISLMNGNGLLRFSVSDDGRGFDPSATGYGTGLQGIADRLAAIGGELAVESEPGRGATISGRVPISSQGTDA